MRRIHPCLFTSLTFFLFGLISCRTPTFAQRADDPPAQVAGLVQTQGIVTVKLGGQFPVWRPTKQGQPVLAGDALWSEPKSRFVLQIGDVDIQSDDGTELGLLAIDDREIQLMATHGSLFIHVLPSHRAPVLVRTPSGAMTLNAPGQYAVETIDQPARMFSTIVGSASLTGNGFDVLLNDAQSAKVEGGDPFSEFTSKLVESPALSAWRQSTAPAPTAFTLPPSFATLPGLSHFSPAGEWKLEGDYQPVWYPHVPANWAPYRNGCWRWVLPWGWTWIAAEEWGFTALHYGRWRHDTDGWGWLPPHAPFVYASAMVDFFQPAPDRMGWIPLAQGETYRPPFDASKEYALSLNGGKPPTPDKMGARPADKPPIKPTVSTLANRDFATALTRAQLSQSACTDGKAPDQTPDGSLPLIGGRAALQPLINVFALPSPPLPGPMEIQTSRRSAPASHPPSGRFR